MGSFNRTALRAADGIGISAAPRQEFRKALALRMRVWRNSNRQRDRPHERAYHVVRMLSENEKSSTHVRTSLAQDIVEHETAMREPE